MTVRTSLNSTFFKSILIAVFVFLAYPWGSTLSRKPFIEDAWYGFTIARNYANGFGITIDGIQETNGFQPLQVLIDSFLFEITNSDDFALELAFSLRLLMHVCSAQIFANLVARLNFHERNTSFSIFSFAVYIFHPGIITSALNGLETGLLLFLFLMFIKHLLCLTSQESRVSSSVITTTYAILLIYTRIDMIILIACVLIWYFLSISKRACVGIIVTLSIAIAPWLTWNYKNFDSVVPISGQQQLEPLFSVSRMFHMMKASLYNVSPWLGSTYDQRNFSLEVAFFLFRVLFFVWVLRIVLSGRDLSKFTRFTSDSLIHLRSNGSHFGLILALLLGMLILCSYYSLMTFSTYFYQRYSILLAPLTLLLILANVNVSTLAHRVIAVAVLLISAFTFFNFYQSNANENRLYDDQVMLVLNSIPASEIVGARQSGTLGYFRSRVINLDGKVNPLVPKSSFAMGRYLKTQQVNWLCDWPSELSKILTYYETDWRIFENNSTVVCLKRNHENHRKRFP